MSWPSSLSLFRDIYFILFNDCIYSIVWMYSDLFNQSSEWIYVVSDVPVTNNAVTRRWRPVFLHTTASEFVDLK